MRSTAATLALVLTIILAAGIFAWTATHALFYASDSGLPAPAQAEPLTAATSSLPSLLIIPSLNISAHVQYVGVNAQGNMRAPSNFTDVAWYELGTVPGQLGSSVIDGHVDNGLGLDGVFKHLDELKVGDDVYIQMQNGGKLHFVVSDIETYQYQDVPLQMLFSRSDAARLNLITCEGTWVPSGDTYDHRIVIYTKLVNS